MEARIMYLKPFFFPPTQHRWLLWASISSTNCLHWAQSTLSWSFHSTVYYSSGWIVSSTGHYWGTTWRTISHHLTLFVIHDSNINQHPNSSANAHHIYWHCVKQSTFSSCFVSKHRLKFDFIVNVFFFQMILFLTWLHSQCNDRAQKVYISILTTCRVNKKLYWHLNAFAGGGGHGNCI